MYLQQPPPGGWPKRRKVNWLLVAFVAVVWVVGGLVGGVNYIDSRNRREEREAEQRAALIYANSPMGRQEAAQRAQQARDRIEAERRSAQEAADRAAALRDSQLRLEQSSASDGYSGRDCYVSGHYRRGRWVEGYYRRCR